jgi:hypothetical protein
MTPQKKIVMELVALAESGDTKQLGKSIMNEQHITQKMLSNYGADCSSSISIDFPVCKGQEVCRINISSSAKPIYVKEGNNEENFYIRSGNSKRKLTTKEATEYCKQHFVK